MGGQSEASIDDLFAHLKLRFAKDIWEMLRPGHANRRIYAEDFQENLAGDAGLVIV